MKVDCISREAAKQTLTALLIETALNNTGFKTDASKVYEDIANNRLDTWLNLVPVAADLRPVVRGYWKPVRESEISGYDPALSGQDPIYMHICSNCGIDSYLDENGQELLTAFCPMCGADMREETDA